MTKKPKSDTKLPNAIVVIKNPDKKFHESWYEKRNLLNIPHPFRAVLLGPPNSGKTLIIKNILIRARPEFQEVYVIHCDGSYTKEYDDVGAEMLSEIPSPDEWEGKVKTLVIIDDLEVKLLSKDQKRALDRLFGYVSTHKNISVILTSQDPFNVPAIVRRCSNLWVLWKGPDLDSLNNISRKAGLKSDELKELFKKLTSNKQDSIWLDLTNHSPAPLRLNGFQVIEKTEEDE